MLHRVAVFVESSNSVDTMSVTYPATLKLIEIYIKGPDDARPTALQVVEDEGSNVNRQADQQGIRGHWCQQRHWG